MSFSSQVKDELLNKKYDHKNKDQASEFLRDAFVLYGTMTDPEKCYHLELSVQDSQTANKILNFIKNIDSNKIEPGISRRNNLYVVYIKACESIMDFLTYIGATGCAMKMMQVKMVKDVRNYANRMTNFETANLDKTVKASENHVRAIKKIQDTVGLRSLPDDLYEIAKLRLENPDMSLNDLGKSLKKRVSRSGVNHRLKRIMKISDEILKDEIL